MTAIDARAAAATRLEGSGNTDDSVVKLAGVTKTYQRGATAVNALDRIDLEVRRGEFAVLVGPSGSGKTTLLNMIGGLDTPTSGRVWVAGTEIGRMSKADRSQMRLRSIGFVFQEFNLIPVLSAIENTEFVMLLQGVPAAERRARACALLKELGLERHGAASTERAVRRSAAARRGRSRSSWRAAHPAPQSLRATPTFECSRAHERERRKPRRP